MSDEVWLWVVGLFVGIAFTLSLSEAFETADKVIVSEERFSIGKDVYRCKKVYSWEKE